MAIVAERHGTIQQAERLASLILTPGTVIEVRAFTKEGYVNRGYFDNVADMLKAVKAIDRTGRYAGIYWTINPVNPALLARAANRIDTSRGRKASTGDGDILHRRWQLIDFDPDRPSGIAATDSERDLAIERAAEARDWLLTFYDIKAVLSMSGNGGTLLVPVDLPNDAESTHLISDVLKVLSEQFGGRGVNVDQSVSNAARIVRIPGTMNRKGDHTEDRPHRRARVIDIPDDLTPVPRATLEAIRSLLKENEVADSKPPANGTPSGKIFDVETFIERAGLDVNKKEPYQGGTKWELNVCPFNPEHTDRSAFIIQFPSGALSAGCHHNGCQGKDWKDLRAMYDPAYALRQELRQNPVTDFADDGEGDKTIEADHDGRFEMAGPNNPLPNAEKFRDERYTFDGTRTLVYMQDEFKRWTKEAPSYQPMETVALEGQFYQWARRGYYIDQSDPAKPKVKPFNPNKTNAGAFVHALRALVHIPKDIEPPAWIGAPGDLPPAHECIPFLNGILHIPTRKLMPVTPRFFVPYHLNYAYDPDAPTPETWLTFLDSIWSDDRDSITTLQEFMGLLLTLDTSFHKALMLVGPPRAGKGVITGTIREMVGAANFASLSLSKFATNFGLQNAIGKSVVAIPDARLSGRADMTQIVENLLAITGGDDITIDRKHREPWEGKLPARLLVMTNELPRFRDASGALANRFIILRMTRSFLGREDRTLAERIREEIPSIMLWALEGLDRLHGRGHFVQPDSGDVMVSMMKDITSPVTTFVEAFCDVKPGLVVARSELYGHYRTWLEARGVKNVPADNTFARDLLAAFPSIDRDGPRIRQSDGSRPRTYQGIGFKPGALQKLQALAYPEFDSEHLLGP